VREGVDIDGGGDPVGDGDPAGDLAVGVDGQPGGQALAQTGDDRLAHGVGLRRCAAAPSEPAGGQHALEDGLELSRQVPSRGGMPATVCMREAKRRSILGTRATMKGRPLRSRIATDSSSLSPAALAGRGVSGHDVVTCRVFHGRTQRAGSDDAATT
jgi:hypothetical protein